MAKISKAEKDLFLFLFNRGGYVLDFSTPKFDTFTFNSIGIALCQKYEKSKGDSLASYLYEAEERNVIKLLLDLFEHYEYSELKLKDEKNKPKYFQKYRQLLPIVERLKTQKDFSTSEVLLEPLKRSFSTEYIEKQIDSIILLEKSNPTDCIGKSKELIESCCKAILENQNTPIEKTWDINKLVSETTKSLELSPKHLENPTALEKSINQILQSLQSIVKGLAEIRNPYGSGHGKSPSFVGLEERHAKLAASAAATLVNFLWDSYLINSEEK